ncbi:TPA: phage tail protein [Enterobacter hormaechei subsp. xiangfangensis]|nr:phage tail protein [Enterobacter hormaechei subsp. xiangfangensis]HED3551755.1 phage tail protein [Enterobacter hormaechei subsp. xiangfangensis]
MQLLHGETIIQGAKGGGGSAHTPVEQPDDLLSVAKLKMLIAVSEGEIQGDLTAQNIFLNDTPLANDSGEYNFSGVKWEFRKGTQDQTYIAGMPQVDNELAVGTTVTTTAPWTRQFTNLSLDAIRIKLSLPVQYLYKDNGDMVGTVTEYAIDLSTDGGAWKTVVNGKFDGKTTTEYQRDHRIDLPKSTSGWSVRVRRITADASGSNSKLVNAFKVFSYAEVIDSKLRYPLTALLYVEVDSSQFNGSAPKVTCKIKGKLIKVPDNYDPTTRTYSGSWSGGFKMAWSNNPAWIFYDLVLDEIYGMGTRVDVSMVDKWALYSIAQYCDEMVSDGAGGTEPRFTCNVFIQSQKDAWQVLNDLAAVFRGITFWGNDQIYVQADVPQDDVDWVYNVSNVIDGLFTYAGGSYKNRYSSCLVSWSDPQNHYSDTVEGVYDSALVERYDVRQTSLTAIGCTSQSEAHRRGRWVLLSNAKDGTVSFGVGLDGYIPLPAEIIGVADPFRSGKENGGRISAVNGRQITLDREIDYAAKDRLVVNLPDGKAQTRTISAVSADKKTVTVATAFSQVPVAGAVWAIDSDNLAIQYFRVTSIAANDDSTGGFTITAVQHDPNKYRYIDDGVRVESPPITVTPISVLSAPKNIVVTESDHVSQGLTVASLDVSWDKVEGAIRYVAQWRKDNGDWINVPVTSAQGFSVQGIYSGSYDVRVRALNAQDTSSPWGYGETTYLSGKTGKPGTPLNLLATEDVVWHIDLTWKFPDGSGDTAYTEIQRATTADYANPELLVLVPYPAADYQHGPMPAGVRQWYRARLIDRIGNAGDWTDWVMGTSSIDVSEITNDILEDMKESETFKDLIENAVDSNEKIAGMADDIKQANDELEQQAKDIAKNAQDVGKVQTSVNEISSTVGDVSSSLSELEQTVATADTALGQRIDSISVSMDGMTGGVKNSAIAIIQNGLAQVAARKTLSATVAGNSAQLDRIDEVIVNEKEATARSLLSLQTDVNGNKASINSLNQTFSDYQQATATQINGITATVNGHTSAITTNAQAIANVNGDLSAMYNIKVGVSSNGQYYAAGMGIGVENTPSGMQSQVIFLADRFAVTHQAGAQVTLPFVIQNGQTIIRDTVIGDGTIGNTKIGNYIQSSTWDGTGNVGWHINKSGYAVFNNVTVRGMVYASGGKFTGTIEATSFVGDVANVGVGSDASLSGTANLVKTITYTDSGSSSLAKNALVEATFYSSVNADSRMNVIIDINGTSKTFSNLPVKSGAYANNFYTLRFGVKGINTNTVTATLTIVNANSVSKIIYSPSLTITRGTGSFVG